MIRNNTYRWPALRIDIGIMMLVLLLAGGAGAATITVNASGGADYTRIQDAVNVASNGDTITVAAGTYNENVVVNKSVSLFGAGAEVTIVNASNSNEHVFNVAANRVNISGFTVIGATATEKAGIYLPMNYANISNNNASNNYIGIGLVSSNSNTLTSNTVNSNLFEGIRLEYSNSNTLIGNNASNSGESIYLDYSSNNTLIGNNASNNFGGIYLHSSSNNTLIGNNMMKNKYNFGLSGTHDYDFDNNINNNNLADGKYLYYEKGIKNIVYDSLINAATFYCISCENVTLKNVNFQNNFYGIFFWNTTNSTIKNITASNNLYGIFLSSSINNMLIANNASNNYNVGIILSSSINNTLIGNNIPNNLYGIILDGSGNNKPSNNTLSSNDVSNNRNGGILISSSNNNTLIGNNVSNNMDGIFLSSSNNNMLIGNNASNNEDGIHLYYSSNNNMLTGNNASNNGQGINLNSGNNTLIGNNASNNNGRGIYLNSANNMLIGNNASNNGQGVYLFDYSNNMLSSNNVSNNGDGIVLSYSVNNVLSDNNVLNNMDGIVLSYSSNNIIYNNHFNNTLNFNSDSAINTWNITKQSGTNIIGGFYLGGNFWANPNGTDFSQTCTDADKDGICDSAYSLNANNVDFRPLATPDAQSIPSEIYGMIFNDTNGNGIMDYGESGLSEVEIHLTRMIAPSIEYLAGTTFTDMSGNYNFTGQSPGFYRIEELPGDFEQTFPANGMPHFINLTEGEIRIDVDFGNKLVLPGEIRGIYFNDSNGNGVMDNGETGMSGGV